VTSWTFVVKGADESWVGDEPDRKNSWQVNCTAMFVNTLCFKLLFSRKPHQRPSDSRWSDAHLGNTSVGPKHCSYPAVLSVYIICSSNSSTETRTLRCTGVPSYLTVPYVHDPRKPALTDKTTTTPPQPPSKINNTRRKKDTTHITCQKMLQNHKRTQADLQIHLQIDLP